MFERLAPDLTTPPSAFEQRISTPSYAIPDRLALLEDAARDELDALWADLDTAVRNAANGQWSITCDWLTDRIKRLTQLVGPTPWEQVQIPLLESGVYQRLHAELDVSVEVDMARVAEVRASIDARRSAR